MENHGAATDVIEDEMNRLDKSILKILLIDRTTRRNIIWATSDYEDRGGAYKAEYPITTDLITEENSYIIQPKITKAKSNRVIRTKKKAEVFTPAWICNE